jgi:hypothetical protein
MEASHQLHASASLYNGQGPLVPTGQEVGWVLESVWTLWKREKLLAHTEKPTATIQVCIPSLSRLVKMCTPFEYMRYLFYLCFRSYFNIERSMHVD